jgi:hypothetical protein
MGSSKLTKSQVCQIKGNVKGLKPFCNERPPLALSNARWHESAGGKISQATSLIRDSGVSPVPFVLELPGGYQQSGACTALVL